MNSQKAAVTDRENLACLIESVRAGDQESFSELLERYSPLIDSLVYKFSLDQDEELSREDLRQEAVLKFYNAILTYDVDQSEVEFGLYAKICISNALVSQLRLQKKHTLEQLTESINTVVFVHDSEDPSDKVLEEERVKALYSVFRDNLSSFEYSVWRLYISGRTAREIGDLVGKDERSINNAIYRIRKKLRVLLR